MVRVNKHQLQKKQLDKLFAQMNFTLANLNADKTDLFLQELLGPEERIIFAKRLAAIILLLEDYSQYKVAKLLKLSPSTTEKIHRRIQSGEFDGIIDILGKSKKNYFAILDTLDTILHLGGVLPHYNGLDRYRT